MSRRIRTLSARAGHAFEIRRAVVSALLLAALSSACTTGGAPASTTPAALATASAAVSPSASVVDTPAPTVEPSSTPTSSPPTSGGPGLNVTWSAPTSGFEPSTQVYGLARLDSGDFIALGQALTIGGHSSMAATSGNGQTWKLAGPGLAPPGDLTLLGAASLARAGDVAIGTLIRRAPDQANGGMAGSATGVAYLRPPGLDWTRVPDQPSLAGANLRGVIATKDRFVAFGGDANGVVGLGCLWGGCLAGVGIWTSTDGLTWIAALREPATPGAYEFLQGLVAGPAGLLAFAQRGDSARTTHLWASPDGATWSEIHPIGLDGIALEAITATADGYVGVAAYPTGKTVFRSADGIHWTALVSSGPSLTGIIRVDGGFVAWNNVLEDTNPDITRSYGVSTSVDGVTWRPVDAYDQFYSGAMLAKGRTLISIGSNSVPNPIWIGTMTVVPPG